MTDQKEIYSYKIKKGNEMLPIGSVVTIGMVKQAIMIYGRNQQQGDKDDMWDYVACPYPQGHLSDESNVFFNHSQIEDVIFKGYEAEGELILRHKILRIGKEEE